jgi:hypothetical protein
MKTAHYLRFAKALIVVALPACSGPSDSKTVDPPTEAPAATQKSAVKAPAATQDEASETAAAAITTPAMTASAHPKPAATVAPAATEDAGPHDGDASADAKLPFSSGPIVPPELPLGFA